MSAPTFSGQTRDFAKFKRDFEALVVPDRYPLDVAEYLRQAVPEEYHHLLNNVAHPEDMMEVLVDKFGNRKLVVNDALSQIEEMGPITTDEEFVHFVEGLEKIIVDFKSLGYMDEVGNLTFISKLESKLPMVIRFDWSKTYFEERIHLESSMEKLKKFMSFLSLSKESIEYLTHEVRKDKDINFVMGQVSPQVTKKEDMDRAAFELRKLRGTIYRKIKVEKSEEELKRTVKNYKIRVNKFVNRFRKVLTKSEKKIWIKKKNKTYNDVLDYCQRSQGYSQNSERDNRLSESTSNQGATEVNVGHNILNQSVGKLNEPFGNILETLPDVPRNEPGSNNITDEDLIRRLGKLKNLPNAEMLEETSVDDEIEARLIRLKFFRKTWCKQPSHKEKASEQEPLVQSSEHQTRETYTTSSIPQASSSKPGYIPSTSEGKLKSCECMAKLKTFNIDSSPNLVDIQGVVLVLVLTFLKLLCHPQFRLRLQFAPAHYFSQADSAAACSVPLTTMTHSTYSSVFSAVKGARWMMIWDNVYDQLQGVIRNCKVKLCILLRDKVKAVKKCSAKKIVKCAEKVAQVARNYGN